MSREIKFRAWDNHNKVMCQPYFEIKTSETNVTEIHHSPIGGYYMTAVMQYTGLTDKNGKEIYEGDILNVHIFTQELGSNLGVKEGEKQFKAEICFQEHGLWIQGNNEEDSGYILWFNGLHEESFEVIGNIYENPDLLK